MTQEGYVDVPGGSVWYRLVGSDGATPLVTLHGGPGAGHDYLEPLEALASDRPVVFYDQLGCGKSDIPDDASLWQIDRFVEEVTTVRRALDLERVHLFGQSWGGWLAIEYMLTRPPGVTSLILASTSASLPQFAHEVSRLTAELPPDTRDALERCKASGDWESPECRAAEFAFLQRHLCRLNPWPQPLLRTGLNILKSPAYNIMQGPEVFPVTGNLKDWDRTNRLSEINVPTLITVGRYDEVTPACAETLHGGISGSELVLFEESSHMAHLEETGRYLQVLRDFLHQVES